MHKRKRSRKTSPNVQKYQNLKIHKHLECNPLKGMEVIIIMENLYSMESEFSGEAAERSGCSHWLERDYEEYLRELDEEDAEYWAELYEKEMAAKGGENNEGLHNVNC